MILMFIKENRFETKEKLEKENLDLRLATLSAYYEIKKRKSRLENINFVWRMGKSK
jgi:hypothetical protein